MREKQGYRENLRLLDRRHSGKDMLNASEVPAFGVIYGQ